MSWPGSPPNNGFQRLDDSEHGPYIDKSGEASAPPVGLGDAKRDAKRKKHYLKFLSRAKKRVAKVSCWQYTYMHRIHNVIIL
jgi:hypothetical protein